jgi:hypothetical protein
MGHWYDGKTGAPRHTVPNKSKGGERSVTVKDARHLKLVPSVSGLIAVAASPGLDEWKVKQVLAACAEWPYTQDLDIEKWTTNIRQMAGRIQAESSERGRIVHSGLEQYYVEGEVKAVEYTEVIVEAVKYMENRFRGVEWTPEKTFAHDGYGGTCDLSSTQGQGIILDFKTKDTDDPKKMTAYMSHAMQLAAYREGLKLPKAKCYNLFISVKQPKLIVLKEWTEEEIQKAYRMFTHLKEYWYLANNMERT